MKWNDHRKWARKAGIPDEPSRFADTIIDLTDKRDLPTDYQQAIGRISKSIAEERGAQRGNSALPLVIANDIICSHDAGRRSTTGGGLAAEAMLRYLESKGTAFARAWHLHHHLDYMEENLEPGGSVPRLNAELEQEYPLVFEPEIARFLTDHEQELIKDLSRNIKPPFCQ